MDDVDWIQVAQIRDKGVSGWNKLINFKVSFKAKILLTNLGTINIQLEQFTM